MAKSLVTLTIGQSPRSDILPLLRQHLPDAQSDHAGLLDGLSPADIAAQYGPSAGEAILVSRLQSGEQVRLAAPKVEQGLQRKISALEQAGYETILLLCTGEFSTLRTRRALLLEPDRIIPPLIQALVQHQRVGIVVPVEEQIVEQAAKWHALPSPPCFAVASPYQGDEASFAAAARQLSAQGAGLVVLDCIGYRQQHRLWLQQQLTVPVLLSNQLVARLAAELLP
ncbi:AroM family protein [Pantoea sp. C2G6]|uniref:AroM family protein n=1 Tax=Pantoea sp. C2G6 TaxID=3243084 RepID=UPI003ED9FAD7